MNGAESWQLEPDGQMARPVQDRVVLVRSAVLQRLFMLVNILCAPSGTSMGPQPALRRWRQPVKDGTCVSMCLSWIEVPSAILAQRKLDSVDVMVSHQRKCDASIAQISNKRDGRCGLWSAVDVVADEDQPSAIRLFPSGGPTPISKPFEERKQTCSMAMNIANDI